MSITPQQREQIVKPVRDGLVDVLTDRRGIIFDRPGFVQGAGPTDPFSNTVRALTQANCRIWAARPKGNNSTRVNLGNSRICNPYLTDIGEIPLEGDIAPPFLGGQCLGTTYNLTYTATVHDYLDGAFLDQGSGGSTGGSFVGPIQSVTTEPRTTGSQGQPTNWRIRIVHGPNATVSFREIVIPNRPPVAGRTQRRLSSFSASFARTSGGPDTCGNPPLAVIPPGISTPLLDQPTSVPVTLPGVGPITVTVNPNNEGDPVFCIPQIDICISVEVDGDDGDGGTDQGDREPGDQGEPGDPQEVDDDGVAEGECTNGALLGVLVEVTSTPPRANRIFNKAESYTKGAYFVYLGGNAGFELVDTAAITRPVQYFSAPEGCNRYRVVPNIGFSLKVTPYCEEE